MTLKDWQRQDFQSAITLSRHRLYIWLVLSNISIDYPII